MSSLERVSPERKRDEVFRILETKRPSVPLRGLEMLGGLPYLFPDLVNLKSTRQTFPHYQNVWDHTLSVLDHLGDLLDNLAVNTPQFSGGNLSIAEASQRLGRYRPQLAHHFQQEISPSRNLRNLVNLAALYHDAAKPETMTVEPDGRIRNFGHETMGASLVYQMAQHAALSRQECDRLRTIVGHHMRIHSLAATGRPPTRRAVYRYFRDTGEAGIDICLLTLADTLGTYGPALPQDTWLATLEVCRVLMEAWWEKHEEQINPLILLNGHEIQDLFHIDPGPKLGELLDNLHETQAAGQVATRAEAIEYIQKMLDNG
jgi:tRNA nucleotidyltransferase/poly(A) polymerase